MSFSRKLIFTSLGVSLLTSCDSTPDYVMSHEKMAYYLADLYTAETIAEINRSDYRTDSAKKVLKQSVMAKHDVTPEQVDTSFVWYGHNIEDYIEVHDRVIEILNENIANAKTGENGYNGVVGDSVDTWQWSDHIAINDLSPSRVIDFELSMDDNWQKGDIYTWAIKFTNNRNPINWGITAEYADGKIEFMYSVINNEGWSKLKFQSDSTQMPKRISGYLMTSSVKGENVYLDSISLYRDRVKPHLYHERYRQRSIEPKKKK